MDARSQARETRKQELLRELSELMTEEQVEAGLFLETPHYSIIERQAINLGRELSRKAQERAAREVAANCDVHADCPECGASCEVTHEARTVNSLDGPVELLEPLAHCSRCRRDFFPSTRRDGAG